MVLGINKLSERPEKEYAKMAKKVMLGHKRPPLFTRILLLAALICFGYYFLWNGLRVALFFNIDTINNPEEFKQRIQFIADKYNIEDGLKSFLQYGLAMMASWAVVGVGMIFIYRRKLLGYYLFFLGLLAAMITPFAFLGWNYSTQEVDWYDYVIPPVLAVIFIFSYKNLKKKKQEERETA